MLKNVKKDLTNKNKKITNKASANKTSKESSNFLNLIRRPFETPINRNTVFI